MARCFPRLQGGCLALPLLQFLLPWRLSCAVAGAPPAVARFSGGRRPLDPGSGRGLARPVAGGVDPAASRPLGAAGGGAIWALWHCRFYPAGRMGDPRFPCWTSAVSLDSHLYDWLWRRRGGNLLPATLHQCAGNGFLHLFASVFASGSGVFAALLPLVPGGAVLASLARRRPLDAAPPFAK